MLPPHPTQKAASGSGSTSWTAVWQGCPRMIARKYEGWYVLEESMPLFICPSCFDTSIRPTPMGKYFRIDSCVTDGQYTEMGCDFADLIMRMAWIFVLMEARGNRSALDTLVYLAKQRATSQCPNISAQLNGTQMAIAYVKTPATCHWFTIANADGKPMTNFTICPQCTAEIEYLLRRYKQWEPGSKESDQFILATPEPCEATCDLIQGPRMWSYLQAIFFYDEPENFRNLERLIQERAHIPECRESVTSHGRYIAMNSASCIIACEECTLDVIQPDVERGAVRWDQFTRYEATQKGFSCSLKVPRVRRLWDQAMAASGQRSGSVGAGECGIRPAGG